MSEKDHCLYMTRQENTFLILFLCVANIFIAGYDMEMILSTQRWLSSTFEMKDMGQADYVLEGSFQEIFEFVSRDQY